MHKDDAGKLSRLFRCVNLLATTKRGYSVKELADKLGTSWRTVYRDLEIIQKTGFTLHKNEITKRYVLPKATDIVEHLSFNYEEADLLRSAMALVESGPLKKAILEKILLFGEHEYGLKVLKNANVSKSFTSLSQAIKNKMQVRILGYRSASSNTVKDRVLEPITFNENGSAIFAFEPATKSCKFFKIERIDEVVVLQFPWEHEYKHEKLNVDIFGMKGDIKAEVTLIMGFRASALMKEEYPATLPLFTKLSNKKEQIVLRLNDYTPLARFVMGLIDDISIVDAEPFKKFLIDKYQEFISRLWN